MSTESHYLRKKIAYHLSALEKKTKLTSIPDGRVDEYYSNVEIKVIEIATLTRKLRDLGKLPDKTLENKIVNVTRFDSKGPDSQRAYADMEKEYSLDKPKKDTLTLARTVDLVIHSYVLQTAGDENYEFTGIFVTSDYDRFKGLYLLELKEFADACRAVIKEYPHQVQSVYDTKLKAWVHKRK